MFTPTVIPDEVVDVVYNINEFAKELYLPEAYVVTRDQEGYLAHIKQKATTATIGAFNLELNAERELIFRLIEELQQERIVKQFHTGRRKAPPLIQMLEDRELFKAIQTYVHRRLDQILQLVVRDQLPLSWEVERRVLVKDFLVDTQPRVLEPQLYFQKKPDAVHYQLHLFEEGERWTVQDREVLALTNQPTGWICADYKLYRLNHINGFLVKPFRQREEVIIPSKSVNAYFRNFIMKIVNKVEVEADGFSVVQHNELIACHLKPVQHLFEERWVLAIEMHYQDAVFGWQEARKSRTSLDMSGEEVRISQVKRTLESEQAFLDKLANFPLNQSENDSHFELAIEAAADNPYALLEWLAQHDSELMAAGFQIESPNVGDKQVQLQRPSIDLEVNTGSDWFDLKGEVVVGEHRFPFLALAKYIRNNDRFYPLPDGTYFLIPEEWMARYKQIADFGQKEGQQLRLTKSQYTLLEVLDIPKPVELDGEDRVEYVPSPLLKAQLRPYQTTGVQWLMQLHQRELGACLADDMGLGKTLQTIAMLLYAKEQKATAKIDTEDQNKDATAGDQLGLFAPPDDEDFLQPLNALIVLPSSLLFNWESEIKKFVPSMSVYQHFGPKRHKDRRLLSRFDTILTTYQTALRDVELLREIEFEYIVLDESQQIKNRESKVFKALNSLNAKHKLSLSGTPIENSLSDLWSQMQFINEGLLGSFNFFRKEFIVPIERQQDEDQKEKLRKLVQPYLLRRTKEEVAKDLPPLSTQVFYTEMTKEQRKVYEREKSAARNYLLENFDTGNAKYRIMVVQTLTKLRQLVNHPNLVDPTYEKGSGKFQDIMEQWDTIRRSGHKVLLFSSFVKHLQLFRQEFDERESAYSWLSGDLSANKRKQTIKRFQEDPDVQSFLISIKTGGTGLNLTAADYVFILDPWWNPTTEQQAIARAHRIGQKNNVIALKFITRDSIEEKILKLQQRKTQLAEDIIGTNGKLSINHGDLDYLLS
ncbi:MAG: DEAD/DEAH box helicase [Bacteroidota bacterium]